MELSNKTLDQIAFNTRAKIEEHMLIVMDKSIHELTLDEQLQTNNKQFKIAITFLTGYNGIFNITDANNKFYYVTPEKMIVDIVIPNGAYELEAIDLEIKRLMVLNGDSDGETFPFTIKPYFTTQGSIIEIEDGWEIDFTYAGTIRNILGFDARVVNGNYNLSDHPVDIISFDNIFVECDIAQGMIINGKRTRVIHNFTMDVNPGYKYIEKFRGGIMWFMMEIKGFISAINFKLRNENGDVVSFNGQSVTFRLSIKEL